jgi:uncharacterized protein (TIGR03435 family)
MLSLTIGLALCAIFAAAQFQRAGPGQGQIHGIPKKNIRFEVASIHPTKGPNFNVNPSPTGFNSGLNTYLYIKIAYASESPSMALGMRALPQVQNLPNWAIYDFYEIKARIADEDQAAWQNQGGDCELLKSAMRNLLKERFHLVLHEQKTETLVFNIVVGKKGEKLKPTIYNSTTVPAGGVKLASGGTMVHIPRSDGRLEWHFKYATMYDLAEFLGKIEPVHDATGLTSRYDFVMLRADSEVRDRDNPLGVIWPVGDLGLELKPGKSQGVTIIVDHIEKPNEN